MTKRILHFIGSLETGGTENMLLLYLKNTKNEGLEHIVCTIYDRGPLREKFEAAGVRLVSLNLSSKLLLPLAFFRFAGMLDELHPDVVHSYLLQENVIARIVCRLAGWKLICGKRDTDRYKPFPKVWLDRLTLGLADLNISNSMAGVRELRSYGVPADKAVFVANGKDAYPLDKTLKKMDAKRKLGFGSEEILLGCVARLYRFKGHEYLINAMPAILESHPNAKLMLVGDGEAKATLVKLRDDLGLGDTVMFMGERNDVPGLLAAMDLFVFPSLREGMPGALMEAMAAGLPVVATDIDGNRELVEDGKNGVLVPPGNSEALAKAVDGLLRDRDRMHKLAMAARETIKKRFSVGLMVTKLDRIYLDF